jgi:type IV pilus assembly protein PilM
MNRIIVTGLNFTEHALCAVMIEYHRNRLTILAIQQFKFAIDIFADNDALNHQEIVNKLLKVKNSQPLFRHRVAVAIPEAAVMTKTIPTDKRLPFEQQCLTALHQFASGAPLPVQQLALDYQPCEQGVMVYAAKKEAIEKRCQWVKKAGMRTVLVDSEKQAFLRLLLAAQSVLSSPVRILLELTSSAMTLGFITDSEQFYRHLPFSQEEVDNSEILAVITRRLTSELERIRALNSFTDCAGIWLINHLEHDDLITRIADVTGLDVQNYPFSAVFTAKRSWQAKSLLSCANACAIALRGIDALRNDYAA